MESTKEMKINSSGFIPDNWREVTLGDHASVLRGGSPRPIEAYLTKVPDGINWIKIGDVGVGDKYINQTEERIIPEGVSRSRKVFKGDFLLSNSMSFGRPYILNVDGCIHDGWLVIQEYYDSFTTDYLYYALSSQYVLEQYCSMAAGSSVLNLNKDIVKKVRILVPPKEEQKKIANALSSIDTLIADLNLAIEKKRQIKEGLMQNLLTGSIRLRGFSGEWHERRLDSFEMVNGSMLKSSDYQNGAIPVIAGGKTPAGYHSVANRPSNTITISGSGAYAGFVSFHNHPIFASDCSTINNPRNADVKYLYFCLLSKQEEIYKCQAGGAQPHVHAKDIKDITIQMPDSFDEQREIAKILTNAEEEILRIELLRDKYSLIKQGMMQELLTGKTRL